MECHPSEHNVQLKLIPLYGTVASTDKTDGSGNLGGKQERPSSFTPSNARQPVLAVSARLGSVGLEGLVLKQAHASIKYQSSLQINTSHCHLTWLRLITDHDYLKSGAVLHKCVMPSCSSL